MKQPIHLKAHFCAALCAVGLVTASTFVFASDTATQTVTFAVSAINQLSVSGNPGALTVSTATAGSAPTPVTDSTTTYSVTTNEDDRKITGSINSDMPAGLTLEVSLAAPVGSGSSTGLQPLTTSPVDLVNAISALNETGRAISYRLSATTAVGVVTSDTRTVTLTILAD